MNVEDPYELLGIARDATADQIRRAYEAKLNGAAAANALHRAQRIDAAYSILRDPHRRELFDREGIVLDLPRLGSDLPAPAAPAPPSSPRATSRKQRRKGRRGRGLPTAITLIVAMSLVGAAVQFGLLRHAAGQAFANDVWQAPSSTSIEGFPVHYGLHRGRLLPAVAPPSAPGRYAFQLSSTKTPPRWDPCAPIRYVVSGNEPFRGANDALTSAIAEVSADTGLQFVYAGTTTEVPDNYRLPYQPTMYGKRWAPVLIAWTDSSVVPRLAGTVVGLGGGTAVTIDGRSRVVSGIVTFDDPDLARMAQRRHGAVVVREVMLHELGHLVGLAHVKDPTQVMYPNASPLAHYSAGDRRGLAILGDGPCPTSY